MMIDEEKSEAWNNGYNDYKRNSWDSNNPYNEDTQEHREYQEGWSFAEFNDKIENGYFDWIDKE